MNMNSDQGDPAIIPEVFPPDTYKVCGLLWCCESDEENKTVNILFKKRFGLSDLKIEKGKITEELNIFVL